MVRFLSMLVHGAVHLHLHEEEVGVHRRYSRGVILVRRVRVLLSFTFLREFSRVQTKHQNGFR